MYDILKTFIRFLWKRDSISAECLCITLTNYMNSQDQKDLGEYFIVSAKLAKLGGNRA